MSVTKPKPRLYSVDALRGMDMFWIIGGEGLFAALFVLTGWSFWQSLAGQMQHSQWHGFTFYDLIFPLFIFLSGVSLGLSAKRLSGDKKPVYIKAVKRLALLILLGIVYNHGWGSGMPAALDEIRYTSVLGRIGVSWFIAAMLVWHFGLRVQMLMALAILLGYWALLALVNIEGYGGVYTLEGSINTWVDTHFLPGITYRNLSLDPEGILSYVPSVVNAMFGVFVGRLLKAQQQQPQLLLRNLLLLGLATLSIGWLWDGFFPVNKALWSSSFVLVSAGYSILLMALFYYLCDVLMWQRWAKPFVVIGVNAIAIYMASSLVNWRYSVDSLFSGIIVGLPQGAQPIVEVLALLGLQLLLMFWLYRRNVVIKV